MAVPKPNPPDWSARIRRLLADLKLTQAGLADRLGISPPTVSRWVQGKHEPTAESYIALGNLSGRSHGVYFWERAGLDVSTLRESSLEAVNSSLRVKLEGFQLIAGSKLSHSLAGRGHAVAIPLLNVTAFGDRIPPRENVRLSEAEIEEVILAPIAWCKHPDDMVSMHLTGESMYPVIPPESIIFIDTAETGREQLHQRLVVVSHRDLGFKVARLQRISGADILVSANHKFPPLDVSNASKWKIFGEVLWWVSRDSQ
jgi:transcriptional regulator with XRE-family HTH domain